MQQINLPPTPEEFARVDHVLKYRKLRAPNVQGTLEVLKLAVAGTRLTAVHFVSTYAVLYCSPEAGAGLLHEDSPLPGTARLTRTQQWPFASRF